MKVSRWEVALGITLLLLSALFYYIHYLVFQDAHHIFIFLIGDVAFVFVEVLLVTMIIHNLLNEREKRDRIEKLNMVIGAFFSEIGVRLLYFFSAFDPTARDLKNSLLVTGNWTEEEFLRVRKVMENHTFDFAVTDENLPYLLGLFRKDRDFLLRILENPTLHEHESFTDVLWSVSHLIEELESRDDFTKLPESDISHLRNDAIRAYRHLTLEWLLYMKHLQKYYPYLFSFAMRTNPFVKDASVVVV